MFILPNLLGFLCFTSLPVLASFLLAFTDWNIITPPEFVGLAHFRHLLADVQFRWYLWNTAFMMLAIPVSMAASLGLALVMIRDDPAEAQNFMVRHNFTSLLRLRTTLWPYVAPSWESMWTARAAPMCQYVSTFCHLSRSRASGASR